MKTHVLCIATLVIALGACTANNPEDDTQLGEWKNPAGPARQLSKAEFQSLSAVEQYRVVAKLHGTLFKGLPADKFFNIKAGFQKPQINVSYKNALSGFAEALSRPVADREYFAQMADINNFSTDDSKPLLQPLALIRELEPSRDLFERWIAYWLANSILFSPAVEIDSATSNDAEAVYNRLVNAMARGESIRDIVYKHEISQENWRRFRSPEDNTREMIEIYLGLFDRDADVPKASLACKDWYLKDEDSGYVLDRKELEQNTEPQFILGRWATSCEDFYRIVAEHALLIPRVTTLIVDAMFAEYSQENRGKLIQSVLTIEPVRFQEIFAAILLSKEYLIYNERPKNFEETFFATGERIYWQPRRDFLFNLVSDNRNEGKTMRNMNQPAFSLKLGRFNAQPLDSLSFAYYHKTVREELLVHNQPSDNRGDNAWTNQLVVKTRHLENDEYLDFLFVSVLLRQPSVEEKAAFLGKAADENGQGGIVGILEAEGVDDNRINITNLVFDYFSRSPELYYLKR